ncbi:tonsoku-like protein isoform X1 [Gadus morhua]|uniref:Tonsoku-like protein n=1 Tax=Gadus morhua TaxID=8049 RepID=A0A8C5FNR8_GADMO|nr:tonsoku-like protein isoform X1 [Gadus morhua]
MSGSREIKLLQRAKLKAQKGHNLKEEADICNQLGELLSRRGDYQAAVEEHQQELSLSEALSDVIGRAVANRKIGECFAEMGNIEAALKHQRRHLELAGSVGNHAEVQRALATIGRTFLFRYESDRSRSSLKEAEEAFRKSLAVVEERLEGSVPARELSEMRARLFLNLGLVCDHQGEPKRCMEFIRRSVYIAEKHQLLEDVYRANLNLGHICFRRSQHSGAVRCLEQARECARKMKDKFSESECCHWIGKVQLSLGDFAAARRSLKKALLLGSQQPQDRQDVKKNFRSADRGCQLEEEAGDDLRQAKSSHDAVGLAEQLGDLYCKVGSFPKALEAYRTQLALAEALGRPPRELAVIHVSLAATHTDLRQPGPALEHYRQELALRRGSPAEECSTWLNMALSQEDSGCSPEEVDTSFEAALECAQRAGRPALQKRVLRRWLGAQRRGAQHGGVVAGLGATETGLEAAEDSLGATEARLRELCAAEGWNPDCSDGEEEEEEEEENSEPLVDSDIALSDSDDDLDGYEKMVSGRRKSVRWNKRNEKGETSLHRACIDGNQRQVQALLEQGHPVNPRDYCGWTPLHEACNHGHHEVVSLLLERGASVNDPGGPLCDGVTPLHDSLACGHFGVARLLVEHGASVALRDAKGQTPMDTLRHWQRTYSRELDRDARQDCAATEELLRKALAGGGGGPAAPARSSALLQDSQLYDAECSEPLLGPAPDPGPARPPRQAGGPRARGTETPGPARPPRQSGGPRARGMESALLYGNSGSDSDHDSDSPPPSPMRPFRPRVRVQAGPAGGSGVQEALAPHAPGPSLAPEPTPAGPHVFAREEYHSVIRGLGSARALHQGALHKDGALHQGTQSPLTSTPALSSNSRPALVPEEEDLADDWLDDDLGEVVQARKKRRVGEEQSGPSGEGGAWSGEGGAWSGEGGAWSGEGGAWTTLTTRSQHRQENGGVSQRSTAAPPAASRGPSLSRSGGARPRPRQAKMTQMSGLVRLGRRSVSRPGSPSFSEEEELRLDTPPPSRAPQHTHVPQIPAQTAVTPTAMPPPIRMRVRVQDDVFLIPVPQSEAEVCTVAWLCEQAARRYYQKCGLLPRLSLQKEGALLSPLDLLLAVLHTNEEVMAEVSSWDLPPLPERYKKACQSLAVEPSARVSRLCEVQEGGTTMTLGGLGLAPAALAPLLRALKLQADLTELRLSGNRFHDDLLPELVATALTMPRLRVLDLSSNSVTGEGLGKLADALKGQVDRTFPSLEELDLGLNPLGDAVSEPLSCLLARCPLLARLSLQACGLTARCLQHHRLMLASALAGSGHLRSVSLSHNALGSTGCELVLKTLPFHHLTHLDLSAVCSEPGDPMPLERLASVLTQQEECSLTHLSLGGNGLTDSGLDTLARCLLVCPCLTSLNLSGNPSVTSTGLRSLLASLREAQRPLTFLDLQGCGVSGDSAGLEGLTEQVKDLRLCSQGLNKLDREALRRGLGPSARVYDRGARLRISARP